MRILGFWISKRRGMSSSQLISVYTKLLERGYLLVFEALQIPTNEGSLRIQQSKMMLSQRKHTSFAGVTQAHRRSCYPYINADVLDKSARYSAATVLRPGEKYHAALAASLRLSREGRSEGAPRRWEESRRNHKFPGTTSPT